MNVIKATQQERTERYRKEIDLSNALDYLCRATGRDIFVMLPEDHVEAKEYLIKEIKQTVERL